MAESITKTVAGMWLYCQSHGLTEGINQKKGLQHLALIENNLTSDEEVLTCFFGLHNYVKMSEHDGNYAYAVTSKRILAASSRMFGEDFKNYSLENVNSISLSSRMLLGVVTVETLGSSINIALNNDGAKLVNEKMHEALATAKKSNETPSVASAKADETVDIAAEIKKFENLLYARVITQEEFDEKRKQILVL